MTTTAYDASLFEDNFPAGVERHFWFRARTRIVDRALSDAETRGLLPPQARIMEVGCGTGIVVAGLSARGRDIRGVEIGRPRPLPEAAPRITAGTFAHDLPAAERERIDALLFLDVIEHVPDDVALLRDTVAAFPNCRCVLVTVPARPEVWSRHDTHYGHYRRYTRPTLRASLATADLACDRVDYVFRSLYLAAAALKLLGRDREPVMRAPARPMLHDVVAAGMRAEQAILGRLPLPGLSLLATARVKAAPP